MTEPKIVLIEDSEPYILELLALIADTLSIRSESVQVIRTEAEFYASLAALENAPPAMFIVDVMIPYQGMEENDDSVPPDLREKALKDKFYRAGIRCANSLLANPKLQNVPIILHSILEKADIESDKNYPIPVASSVRVCKKEANGHGIIEAAQQVLKGDS